MSALSKLAIALTVVFVVSITALAAQLVCVKWRQRRFRRRSLSSGDRESISTTTTTTDAVDTSFYAPSKELLYFFFWNNNNNQSQVEADGPTAPESRPGPTEPVEFDNNIFKWHVDLYGPPMFLFTVKNEREREMFEPAVNGSDLYYNNGNGVISNGASAPPAEEEEEERPASLTECVEEEEVPDEAVDVAEEESYDADVAYVDSVKATPFSTPCPSPPYFTPSPSPAREHHVTIDNGEDTPDKYDDGVSERDAPKFVSLVISG